MPALKRKDSTRDHSDLDVVESLSSSEETTDVDNGKLIRWCEETLLLKITKLEQDADRWVIEASLYGNEVFIKMDIAEDTSIKSIFFDDKKDYPEIERWLKKQEAERNIQEIIQGIGKYIALSEQRKDVVKKLVENGNVSPEQDKQTGWKLDFDDIGNPITVYWSIGPMKRNPYVLTHCFNVHKAESSDSEKVQIEDEEGVMQFLESLKEAQS